MLLLFSFSFSFFFWTTDSTEVLCLCCFSQSQIHLFAYMPDWDKNSTCWLPLPYNKPNKALFYSLCRVPQVWPHTMCSLNTLSFCSIFCFNFSSQNNTLLFFLPTTVTLMELGVWMPKGTMLVIVINLPSTTGPFALENGWVFLFLFMIAAIVYYDSGEAHPFE